MKRRITLIILALAVAGAAMLALRRQQRDAEPLPTPAVVTLSVPPPPPANRPSDINHDERGVMPASLPDPTPPASAQALEIPTATAVTPNTAIPVTDPTPTGAAAESTRRPPVVGIQDGRTINFSSGQPVIIDAEKENAALAKALKEMEEATRDRVFHPGSK